MKFRNLMRVRVLALAGGMAVLAGCSGSSDTKPKAAAPPASAGPGALPGMPPVLDPADIYAADHAGNLSDAVRSFPSRVYVPNSGSNTVDVIDPKTFKVIGNFSS